MTNGEKPAEGDEPRAREEHLLSTEKDGPSEEEVRAFEADELEEYPEGRPPPPRWGRIGGRLIFAGVALLAVVGVVALIVTNSVIVLAIAVVLAVGYLLANPPLWAGLLRRQEKEQVKRHLRHELTVEHERRRTRHEGGEG